MGGGRGKVRLMFQDEAGFGRISKPGSCWITGKMRPVIAGQHVREYRYAFGAVDPRDGESFFMIMPKCNTDCTALFLQQLSEAYPDDYILLVMDNASWHGAKALVVPENIKLMKIPPYTPEMNPIEQIWKELRKGFANKFFDTLNDVLRELEIQVANLSHETVKSITGREWILNVY
jgi:putative transposase